jgi:hypothetical protein
MYTVILFAVIALGGAIVLLVLMRVLGKRDEPVNNMEATISIVVKKKI